MQTPQSLVPSHHWWPKTLALLGMGAVSLIAADLIPPDRRMAWTPGTVVGVPGGIPARSTVFVDVRTTSTAAYRCTGTGLTDDSDALLKAMNDCPPGQVVLLPAGHYRVTKALAPAFKNGMTLRGAGPDRTIITPDHASGKGALMFGDGSETWPRPMTGVAITAGAVAGSATVTLNSTTGITVGKLVRIDPVNPAWVHNLNGMKDHPSMSFMFKVVAKTGTTVTLTPPIPYDLSAMNPTMVPYSPVLVEGVGIEDLTIDLDGSADLTSAVYVEQGWGCWLTNVEIRNANNRQMFLIGLSSSEIRHCHTHDTKSGGANHEGIDFYEDCCWNLIEDNICYNGGFPGIILGDSRGGCQGNVIAYNFCGNVDVGAKDTTGADISFSHGSHNMLNLAEGNIIGMIQSDGYFGSSSHNTIFRNWITATHPTATQGLRAIALHHFTTFYNVIGNVLGSPGFPGAPAGAYATEAKGYSNGMRLIYQLGYPNMGNTDYGGGSDGLTIGLGKPPDVPDYRSEPFTLGAAQALDLHVKGTVIRHGNYDYSSASIIWDPAIATQVLPPSLCHASKPDWFGSLAWPPIDPTHPERCSPSCIPAGYRFIHAADPPRPAAH